MTWFDMVFKSQFNSFLFICCSSINQVTHYLFMFPFKPSQIHCLLYCQNVHKYAYISFSYFHLVMQIFILYFSIIIFINKFFMTCFSWHSNVSSCTKHIYYILNSNFHGWLFSHIFSYSSAIPFPSYSHLNLSYLKQNSIYFFLSIYIIYYKCVKSVFSKNFISNCLTYGQANL